MSSFAFRSLNIKKDISVSFYSLCVSDRKRTEMCRCGGGEVAEWRGAEVPRCRGGESLTRRTLRTQMCFIITSYFIPHAHELMCHNMNDVVKALLTLVPA